MGASLMRRNAKKLAEVMHKLDTLHVTLQYPYIFRKKILNRPKWSMLHSESSPFCGVHFLDTLAWLDDTPVDYWLENDRDFQPAMELTGDPPNLLQKHEL